MLLRHLLSILFLPFLAAVVIPLWLLTSFAWIDHRWAAGTAVVWLPRLSGALVVAFGLCLLIWCIYLFVRFGQGTIAPWNPTRKQVAAGPYRFVRNPMIIGVALVLSGQAIFWGSWVIALWTCIFILVNHFYFVFSEEPGLECVFRSTPIINSATNRSLIPEQIDH